MVVVFPAPFGPSRAQISPGRTANEEIVNAAAPAVALRQPVRHDRPSKDGTGHRRLCVSLRSSAYVHAANLLRDTSYRKT
jgi:hypothetical protein